MTLGESLDHNQMLLHLQGACKSFPWHWLSGSFKEDSTFKVDPAGDPYIDSAAQQSPSLCWVLF